MALGLLLAPALVLGQPGGGPPLQSLDAVVMQVFDKDHSGSVSPKEADSTLSALGGMVSGMKPPGEEGGGPSEIEGMIDSAKKFAPNFFALLDSDGSKTLNKDELKWITKFQKVLQNGELRNLTRDVFAALDADEDGSITAAESETEDQARLARVVELVREVFPLPNLLVDTADAEQSAVLRGHLKTAFGMLDVDSDGAVTKLEAGKAFKAFRQMFLKAAKTLREMGPMLAMFGGMDMPGEMRTPGVPGGRGSGRAKKTEL
jgi:Ca2+-binding EF-hand superfamily protein